MPIKDYKRPITFYVKNLICKNDTIFGETAQLFKKKKKISFKSVNLVTVEAGKFEFKYFNPDSIEQIVKKKNDSLKSINKLDSQFVVFLKPLIKHPMFVDSIFIFKDASYSITFKDGTKSYDGIIKNITKDSIFITSMFNKFEAKNHKKEYKLLSYSINDIIDLRIGRKDGMGYRHLTNKKYCFQTIYINVKKRPMPHWYDYDYISGDIYYYVVGLFEIGYYGIREEKGHIY